MKYGRVPNETYKVIPVKPLEDKQKEEKDNGFKRVIQEIVKVNDAFLASGAGKTVVVDGVTYYNDPPNLSWKLWKKDGKIHQYISLPTDKKTNHKLIGAIQEDVKSCRFVATELAITNKDMYAFAVQGLPEQFAINLDGSYHSKIKTLLTSIKDQVMYSLTIKEIEDHDSKRKELKKRYAGVDPDKTLSNIWYMTKKLSIAGAKEVYDVFAEDETKAKHQELMDNWKSRGWIGKVKHPMSQRKVADTNRYILAEVMFIIRADEEHANKFQSELQQLMTEIQGENKLQVIPVTPDLDLLTSGHLQYGKVPQLTLYQRELSQLLYMPTVDEIDKSIYHEFEQKTEIPEYAMGFEPGAVAIGKRMDTLEIISLPRTTSETDLDDRGTPTIVSGKKGSGKTEMLINQVVDTFCLSAKTLEEWRKKSRSAVVIDVADGDMIRGIYEQIPDWLMDRVVVLNHADLENPIPITNHDIININKSDGIEEDIASTEVEILMDALEDKGKTIAVERYLKMVLQASYIAGEGNLIDAMQIIEKKDYRDKIIDKLDDKNVFLPVELRKMDAVFETPEDMETIDNRVSRLKNTQPWIDALAQTPTEGMDFWRWINGDEDGAYLVLIYIPKRINKPFRSFLFAHYFAKLWAMTEAREIISKKDRKEFLVVIDELHQIFGHRVVPKVLEAVYKEARKYRARFLFTIHGWSSIKDKEVKDIIKDSSGNYIMLKGGDDMFSSLEKEFKPYTVQDFNNLMKLDYTGLFKVDIKKKSHVFMAKLMEPASIRFQKYRKISLEEFRTMPNQYGRPKAEVRKAMKKEETKCQEKAQPKPQSPLAAKLAKTISG